MSKRTRRAKHRAGSRGSAPAPNAKPAAPARSEPLGSAPAAGRPDHSTQARVERRRRARQRRNRIRYALAGAAAAVLVVIGGWAAGIGQPDYGESAPSEGGVGQHIAQDAPLRQRNDPPSSGPHYASRAAYGVTTAPVAPGNWVHALEHGGIVVLYRCGDPEDCAERASLLRREVYTPAREGASGERKLVITPYPGLDTPYAALAWGRILQQQELDAAEMLLFYDRYLDRGPEHAA